MKLGNIFNIKANYPVQQNEERKKIFNEEEIEIVSGIKNIFDTKTEENFSLDNLLQDIENTVSNFNIAENVNLPEGHSKFEFEGARFDIMRRGNHFQTQFMMPKNMSFDRFFEHFPDLRRFAPNHNLENNIQNDKHTENERENSVNNNETTENNNENTDNTNNGIENTNRTTVETTNENNEVKTNEQQTAIIKDETTSTDNDTPKNTFDFNTTLDEVEDTKNIIEQEVNSNTDFSDISNNDLNIAPNVENFNFEIDDLVNKTINDLINNSNNSIGNIEEEINEINEVNKVDETQKTEDTSTVNTTVDISKISSTLKINGLIDEDIVQGETGDCWLIAGLYSMSKSSIGKDIIKNSIQVNDDSSVTVSFKGIGISYTINEAEIKVHDTDNNTEDAYSNGDNDMLVMELAVEKLWSDINSGRIKLNTKDTDLSYSGDGYGIENGGLPEQIIYYLTGIESNAVYNFNLNKLNSTKVNNVLNKASNSDNTIVTAIIYKGIHSATLTNGTKLSLYLGDFGHALSVTNVDNKNVTVINPWDTSKTYTMSREEFVKLGIGYLTYADLSNSKEVNNIVDMTKGSVDLSDNSTTQGSYNDFNYRNYAGGNSGMQTVEFDTLKNNPFAFIGSAED